MNMNDIELNTNAPSIFKTLSSVNVESFTKGKNGYKFLSWSHAVNQLLKYYPAATWKHREWDGLPYLSTPAGCFVEVGVTINDITRSQLHPVLDYRNKPIKTPDAFQLNTSLQRSLAKAISLHGLGLYIYQGEDMPMDEKEAIESRRSVLAGLLSAKNKYTEASAHALSIMSIDQIESKIEEYS
jgi:hypothetical protein